MSSPAPIQGRIPPLHRRALRQARRTVAKWYDVDVPFTMYGATLRVPLSHDLPYFTWSGPHYGTNVGRLAAALHDAGRPDSYIDIGANVGDTAHVLSHHVPGCRVLCIEGDRGYYRNLTHNIAGLAGVEPLLRLVGGRSGPTAASISRANGTGKLAASAGADEDGAAVPMSTLADIIAELPRFADTALLKTDTDGYDFTILGSAVDWLATAHPVIFTEYQPALTASSEAAPGPDGPELLRQLSEIGYGPALAWDNYGFPMAAFDVGDALAVADLDLYAQLRRGFFVDLAIFPRDLADVAAGLRRTEHEFFAAAL
jgi:FkbM family methyltransferase